MSQFAIGADGTLAPLMPASVPAAPSALGVAIAPGGQSAYVLASCVDSARNGQVAEYGVGADGSLAATGAATLTGGHANPVAMVTDGSGVSAYVLVNVMGVDTNAGTVLQYSIDNTGALGADTPSSLGISAGAVAEATYGPNLYALSSNALGFASGGPRPGGHVDHNVIGAGGLLTLGGTATVTDGYPTALALVPAH